MDNLNNIPSAGNWGDAASKLNDNFNKVKQAVTTIENTSKNNKGYFASLSALNTAFPNPKAGQTAYVYSEASSTKYYIYNAFNGGWVTASVEAPSIGVDISEYTKTGGSTKTTKEVDDEVAQLAGEVGVATDWIDTANENLSLLVYDGLSEVPYSELIGAWRSGAMNPSSPISYIRENIHGYLELRIEAEAVSEISYVTTNKIDVTGLNMIEVEMENISVGTTATIRTRVYLGTSYTQPYASGTVILYKTGTFARQKFLIDVSNYTGLYYLHISAAKNVVPSNYIPHLKVYSVNFISKIQTPNDIKNAVNEITPERFQFMMGYGNANSYNLKVIVDESNGLIKFPASYKIIDRQGSIYTGAGGKTVSAIPTNYDTGDPVETTQGFLIYNKINNEVRVVSHIDWGKISDEWLTLAVVKRTSSSITKAGNITLHTFIQWEYENATSLDISKDVVARNIDMQAAVHAAINKKFYTALGAMKKRFNFIHFTDNHGDTKTTGNVIRYLNETPEIDMAINTGDMLAGNFTSSKNVITQMSESTKPILPVLGNHDVGNSMDVALCGDHIEVYNSLIKPFNDKGWIDAQGKNYWFKDFTSDKIRLIALYEFDEPLDLDEIDPTKYKLLRGTRVYSQEQIDWLINTLMNTPPDYHLILLVHQNQQDDNIGTVNVEWNSVNTTIGTPLNYIDGDLVPDLINAWQNGTSINESYSFLSVASYLPPVSVIADFSSRGLGTFVGYVHGHSHIDIIGTLGKYPSQNFFSCVPTINNYPENNRNNDIPRISDTKTEDAFNLITVDTTNRKVFIVRIGSNYTDQLKERKTLVVPY
jgi:hypothetical protein